MTPLHPLCNPAPLRVDIADPKPGRFRLLRTRKGPHRWLVVPDGDAATGGPLIGGR